MLNPTHSEEFHELIEELPELDDTEENINNSFHAFEKDMHMDEDFDDEFERIERTGYARYLRESVHNKPEYYY